MAKKKKMYRGAYSYLKNGTEYSEETFDVFKDMKETGLQFDIQVMSRVSTGEILKINIEYKVNKSFIPQYVKVEKILGNNHITETYTFDTNRNILTYTFSKKGQEEEIVHEIPTSPTFFISTPCVCTSMLFLRSKKFNNTGKNNYTLYNSHNNWDFEAAPSPHGLVVEKLSQGMTKINVSGNELDATEYRLNEHTDDNHPTGEEPPSFKCFTSKYSTIPYMLTTNDGTSIQVKFFNDLSEGDR